MSTRECREAIQGIGTWNFCRLTTCVHQMGKSSLKIPARQDKLCLPSSLSEALRVREKVSNSRCVPISIMGKDVLIHLQSSSGDISSVIPKL